ncbi:MAG: hypothetical protein B7C24_12285 [Bacteroidetes bacterium 4572_77]|nr:MAG: hypothetical protein B7C24_12285 [Bacteroidetes bacterium 4572_77]
MKQYWTHKLIITIAMLFSVGYGYAQTRSSFYKPNAWFVGADAGANVFFGDIKYWDYMPNTKYGELTYAYGVRFGKQLSPRVLVKADAHYSTHSGTKRTSSLLRTFEAVSYDATLSLQLNIMEMMHSRPKQQKLSIWGELGIGYMRWQSLLYNYRTGDTLNNLNWKTKEYENALVFPVGMNIKYYLSPKISLDAYSSLRIVNSDLLDAKPGGIKFDYYWYNALAVNYHIGSSSKSSSDKKEKYSRQSSTSGFYSDDSWFGGFDFGANIFYGDIKYWDYVPNTKYGELSYGYGLRFGKQFSPRVMLKADFHKAELSGTKRTPSLLRKFDAKTFDFSLSVQLNLMEFLHSTPEQRRLSLWGELGIGYINWQAILYNYRTGDTINNLLWNTKEYNAALMIPLGFNIKYYLNDRFSLDAYSSLRVVNSDEVDGKIGGIKFDYYWYAALGINYHFSIFGSGGGASSKELILLDYYALYPKEDTLKKKEVVVKDTSLNNPFYVDLWVPEEANNKAFSMLVKIIKKDKTANGYFHLSLPSGFYPIPPEMPEVKYTRIAYNYDFDFYIPEDQDTLKIPIGINISEREDGIYPIFLEGEAMNEIGELFPIKAAQYVKIGPDNYNNTQEDFYIKMGCQKHLLWLLIMGKEACQEASRLMQKEFPVVGFLHIPQQENQFNKKNKLR